MNNEHAFADLIRIRQLASELYSAIDQYLENVLAPNRVTEGSFKVIADPFAFITAPTERESLRVTADHPDWTAAQVAAEVRRLLSSETTDKSVRTHWKKARKDPRKRALLPPGRLMD